VQTRSQGLGSQSGLQVQADLEPSSSQKPGFYLQHSALPREASVLAGERERKAHIMGGPISQGSWTSNTPKKLCTSGWGLLHTEVRVSLVEDRQ
jgi:hypothetical protein